MAETATPAPVPKIPTPAPTKTSARLLSLDALRGFDMFWIIGGEHIFHLLAAVTGWAFFAWTSHQLEHVEWNGFVFYDMIFPLFLFISGVAMPFSLGKRLEKGDKKRDLALKVIRRGLTLVLFGIIYNNGIFQMPFEEMRFPSVLGRIGLAYLFAGLIFLHTRVWAQAAWGVGLLLAYWAALMLIPVPGYGAGNLTVEGSLVAYLDRLLLPGKLYLDVHDPEGLLSTVPAISTALMGVFAGHLLRWEKPEWLNPWKKVGVLAGAGVLSLALGFAWGLVFPINKNLWTSSFVLFAGGWSLLLLALFYAVIDVWGKQKWAFFFIVIGMNAITIYMGQAVIDFGHTTDFFFSGLLKPLGEAGKVLWWVGFIGVEWVFLYFLYSKKVFLRV